MNKKFKILLKQLFITFAVTATLIYSTIYLLGCNDQLPTEPPNPKFSLDGIWQNSKDSVLDDINYPFIQTYFVLTSNGSRVEGNGYFIFKNTKINLSTIKGYLTNNNIDLTAEVVLYNIYGTTLRGNIIEENGRYKIRGYLSFTIYENGDIYTYAYLLHLVQQSIEYLPKKMVDRQWR
jgi:hypothetical protein